MSDRGGIETLLYLLDEAFGGAGIEASDESQALLPNLAFRAGRRLARAAGGPLALDRVDRDPRRRLQDHVRRLRLRPGTLQFATPGSSRGGRARRRWRDVFPWLEAAQGRLVDHVAALADDAELDAPRPTNWGERRPTRWIVAAMITHDAYHAGEINHLRSLLGHRRPLAIPAAGLRLTERLPRFSAIRRADWPRPA